MKIKNYFFSGLIALSGMLVTSCNNDDITGGVEGEEASITIKLANSDESRSLLPITDTEESEIKDYQVYVFSWRSGIVERIVQGDPSKTTLITGLKTATTKRVVVLANLGAEGNYPKVNNYEEFTSKIEYMFNLDLQTPELVKTDGFFMSGQSTNEVVLSTNDTNEERINLKRIVAKVSLESITFVPEEGHDLSKLEILGVSVQRVTPNVTLAPITGHYSVGQDGYHYGGFESMDSQMRKRNDLVDEDLTITQPYEPNKKYDLGNYFFVFPNTNEDYCTLLTIKAKYNDEVLYYPIKVNYKAGDQNTDGSFVQSNTKYKLNITLKRFGDGTTDPEIPGEDADLDVIIDVENWAVITQNEEW